MYKAMHLYVRHQGFEIFYLILQLKVSDCSYTSGIYSIIRKKKLYDFIEVSQIIQRLLRVRQNTPKNISLLHKSCVVWNLYILLIPYVITKAEFVWSNAVFFTTDSSSKLLRLLKLYWIKHHTLECQSLQLVWTHRLFLTQCRYPHLTETRGAFWIHLLWQILLVKAKIFQIPSKFTGLNVKYAY